MLKRQPGVRYIMLLDRGPSEWGRGPWGPASSCCWTLGNAQGAADARRPWRGETPLNRPPQPPSTVPGEAEGHLARPCYVLDKAWNAQQAGADALLVVNDHAGDLSTAVAPVDEDSTRWAGRAG